MGAGVVDVELGAVNGTFPLCGPSSCAEGVVELAGHPSYNNAFLIEAPFPFAAPLPPFPLPPPIEPLNKPGSGLKLKLKLNPALVPVVPVTTELALTLEIIVPSEDTDVAVDGRDPELKSSNGESRCGWAFGCGWCEWG